ncbi:unnamed protein product [Rangifer tarandus platyrhynchus]|uniref:Uncharacterized protein n=1 Tax=Rangifer tarandus platyrhynchus TaxID=3082113 RepID=A0AC59Z4J2_RANTA
MGSAERDLGRGSALEAGADWRAANLPAALQGGARRAIFRGLYKGVEAAAQRPGSVSARDGEGRGDTRAGSRDAEAAGFGPHAGLRPPLWCQMEPRAAGAGAPQKGEGRVSPFWRGRGRSGATGVQRRSAGGGSATQWNRTKGSGAQTAARGPPPARPRPQPAGAPERAAAPPPPAQPPQWGPGEGRSPS